MCDPLIRYVMVGDAQADCFDLGLRKTTADRRETTNKDNGNGNRRSLRDDKKGQEQVQRQPQIPTG